MFLQLVNMNYSYIFQYLDVPDDIITIVDPFCRYGDTTKILPPCVPHIIERYDIYPKVGWTKKQDTLLFPPSYENKYILTHAPAKEINEFHDGVLIDIYQLTHKYKCFIKNLITNICLGGIIALPAHFWFSMSKSDIELRNEFQNVYKVKQINFFRDLKDKNFKNNICGFQFEKKQDNCKKNKSIPVCIFPKKKRVTFQEYVVNYHGNLIN